MNGAGDRSGKPSYAADHHSQEERDRQLERISIRCDELNRNCSQSAGYPGDGRADSEGKSLVESDIDSHSRSGYFIVSYRHHRTTGPAAQKVRRCGIDGKAERQR